MSGFQISNDKNINNLHVTQSMTIPSGDALPPATLPGSLFALRNQMTGLYVYYYYDGTFWEQIFSGGNPEDLATVLMTGDNAMLQSIRNLQTLGLSSMSGGNVTLSSGSTGNYTLTFPISSGVSGQFLTSYGGGNLTWYTPNFLNCSSYS